MNDDNFFNEEENTPNNEGENSSEGDDSTSIKRLGKHMSYQKKRIIFEFLLEKSKDLKLRRGSILFASIKFAVPTRTISRIWSDGKKNIHGGLDYPTSLTRNTRRKRVIDFSIVKDIELRRRGNIRSLAAAMNEPKSTIHRRIRDGDLNPHTNNVKPLLTEENKKARLRFCLSMIIRNDTLNVLMFSSMMNVIHLEEKWFYMTKKCQRYYLHPDETIPLRTCKSLNFIDKVMFLAVVARPRYDSIRNEMFQGKIGIFPYITQEPAMRNSKNRPAGTLVTKSITAVTKDVTKRFLNQKVLPAIRSKWPGGNSTGTIIIQQDNAKPHISPDDPEFLEAAAIDRFDIRLRYQPPNSPDLNVLDLGFFRAIQSLQHQQAPATIDDLVAVVEKAFDDLEHEKLDKIFLALQLNMIEVMKACGGNNYKQPHFNEEQRPRGGHLPLQLNCDEALVNSTVARLSEG